MTTPELLQAAEQLVGDPSMIDELLTMFPAEARETTLSLDKLEAQIRQDKRLQSISRAQLWGGLQRMDRLGFGRAVIGRRTQPTRLVLTPGLTLGQIAEVLRDLRSTGTGGPPTQHHTPSGANAPPLGTPSASPHSPQLTEHSFRLRPGVVVTLRLPDDLSERDVERLCGFLRLVIPEKDEKTEK